MKVLKTFHIVAINIIAVDSIRTLPFSAELGLSLVFFYILACFMFLIPTALVSAELGSAWPMTGGIYVWVREAFGKKAALITIWLNWIYNVFWYPTILALLAGTFTYFFNPKIADNKIYMSLTVLILFWIATIANLKGMRLSSILSSIGAMVGTLLPMLIIIILGIIWILDKNTLQFAFTAKNLLPNFSKFNNVAFLGTILFGLMGLEMAATHAKEMKNPKKDYPKALGISVILIMSSIILSSLAIALVVPHKNLSLITGVMQAFDIFFSKYNMNWFSPFVAFFIILGGLSSISAWIIGPTKGLMIACEDKSLPKMFSYKNKHNVPVKILILQAIIVSILCLTFILMPTINSSFWLLSDITAQLALIVYIFLFLTVIKLRYLKPNEERPFKIPFKNYGVWTISLLGISICIFGIIFGFIPPKQLGITNILKYEFFIFFGMTILIILPLLFGLISKILRRKKI